MLANLPDSLIQLNLANNKLGRQNPSPIIEVFKNVKEGISKLDLRGNDFSILNESLFIKVFRSFCNTVKKLDLRNNGIEKLPLDTLEKIQFVLSDIDHIILDRDLNNKRSLRERKRIKALFFDKKIKGCLTLCLKLMRTMMKSI